MASEHLNRTLYIPLNIKTRLEFFDGFGVPELITTLIVTGLATVLAVAASAVVSASVTALAFFVLVSMAATVMMVVKDSNNLSIVDQIRYMAAFAKMQKQYRYQYWDRWWQG